MQEVPQRSDLDSGSPPAKRLVPVLTGSDVETQQRAGLWVGRMTSVIGLICLLTALILWLARQNHYRPVLTLLTIAMFAAILHSYTFENNE